MAVAPDAAALPQRLVEGAPAAAPGPGHPVGDRPHLDRRQHRIAQLVRTGRQVSSLDQTGLAQKGGAVIGDSPENGVIDPETVRAAVRPEDVHFPRSRLLCLENTHNTSGGKVFPLEDFAAVATTAKELGLKVHLDGARLFNAQAATGVPASEWCAHADTVSVCSSKGLGAPVGSLLAGDEETIMEARRVRKAFGGGMRQAGIIAAAALYAFENHVDRLGEDHEHASNLASGLREAGYEAHEPDTNLVLVAVDDPPEFLQALAREGVLATPGKPGYVRLCTHLDVGEREIEAAIQAAARITTSAIER